MVLPLPATPVELKTISPYLQRADELSAKDPVIAYWCAYYAAQQGIAFKVKDTSARQFLFAVLTLLEQMKADLGANDAVHDEPASAAYIENFALRVFAGADTEDRKGGATRATAKKFLAAANFFELLRVFEPDKVGVDLAAVEEKIKYSKWKAADIAKAFREGRKPTPGPAGATAEESSPAFPELTLPDPSAVPLGTPPSASSRLPSSSSPPSIVRSTPPPPQLTNLNPAEPTAHLSAGPHLPDGLAPPQPPQSPGSWSTAATPGSPKFVFDDASSVASSAAISPRRTGYASEALENGDEDGGDGTPSPTSAAKSVHFSPSVIGGMSSPGVGPAAGFSGPDPFVQVVVSSPPASPYNGHPQLGPSASNSPATTSHSLPHPSAPPVPPTRAQPARAPSPPVPYSPGLRQDLNTATVTMSPPALTPQVVTRVQKHCRYAISALDYEDAEQAIKELRAALRMLGG
ncbi:Vta1 like-domain-containing protein [Trametes gibbosa]|nr:Vta1 like-domain-containing protein [Trametes gibbosa]